MGESRVRVYDSADVSVIFDGARCIHAARCVRGLPRVFDTAARPWMRPANASADEVVEVVARCPTGALHTVRHDGGPDEQVPPEVTVEPVPDGPLHVRGAAALVDPSGGVLDPGPRYALCRCGASGNRPFCDGSHARVGFTA